MPEPHGGRPRRGDERDDRRAAAAAGLSVPDLLEVDAPPMRRSTGNEIDRLIQLLARLPGLGPRSARRAALHLINNREKLLEPLLSALGETAAKVTVCSRLRQRGHLRSLHHLHRPAPRPLDHLRRRGGRRSVGARAGGRDGRPLPCAGRHAFRARRTDAGERSTSPRWSSASRKAASRKWCLPSTPPSRARPPPTTSPIVSQGSDVTVSRLAHGVPVGGELDYLDEGTLTAAMRQRRPL